MSQPGVICTSDSELSSCCFIKRVYVPDACGLELGSPSGNKSLVSSSRYSVEGLALTLPSAGGHQNFQYDTGAQFIPAREWLKFRQDLCNVAHLIAVSNSKGVAPRVIRCYAEVGVFRR